MRRSVSSAEFDVKYGCIGCRGLVVWDSGDFSDVVLSFFLFIF